MLENKDYQGGENREGNPENDQSGQGNPNMAGQGWQTYQPQQPQNSGFRQPQSQSPQGTPENQEYQFDFNDYNRISQQQAAGKPKGKNTGLKIFAVILSVLLLASLTALAGTVFYFRSRDVSLIEGAPSEPDTSVSTPAFDITLNEKPAGEKEDHEDGGLSTPEIAKRVRPSVVGVVTYVAQNPLSPADAGSGVIMTDDGYIVTNAHVVSGASGIVAVLDNGEEYEAKLIGIDEQTDLAVIKIDAENLTPAEFGDSSELVVGERVVAIGNPTGLELAGTTTQGIVSGLQRTISIQNENGDTLTMEVIQVDAAINPGNSGGALINRFGQVVGINSSKINSTAYEGIGFAIPMNNAKPIVDDLVTYGYVRGRVRLGITYYPISDVLGAMYGYTPGLLVYSVDGESDAFQKGLRAGDIITQIDGQDVRDKVSVQEILEAKDPGDTIRLSVIRQSLTGKTQTSYEISVILSEATGDTDTSNYSTEQGGSNTPQNPT